MYNKYNNLINEIDAFAATLAIDSVDSKTFDCDGMKVTVYGTIRTVYTDDGDISHYESVLFDEDGCEFQDGSDFVSAFSYAY